ncbi:MAG: Fic family protein, partial [Acidimicrobiia bacterium]|nr:Fic family protein [Acidimicrobiia bacterium]
VEAITILVDSASAGPITIASMNEAHRELLAGDPLEGAFAGIPRAMQDWFGGNDFTPRLALYVPPPAGLLDALLDDLATAANRVDLPSIAQAAIVHAQFESVHPYTDGNGRIGRALINAVLRRRGLTTRVVVPVASVMLADVPHYFAQLDGYRMGNADDFVRYLTDATAVAATEAVTSAQHLADLPEQWRASVKLRKGSAADRLLDRVLETPVLTDKSAAAAAGSPVRRIYAALDRLTEAEILTEITGKERDRVWVVSDVLDELDRLEERVGRRRTPAH